jgi:hypothetical protein
MMEQTSRKRRAHVETKKKDSTSVPLGQRRRYIVLSFRSSAIQIFFINMEGSDACIYIIKDDAEDDGDDMDMAMKQRYMYKTRGRTGAGSGDAMRRLVVGMACRVEPSKSKSDKSFFNAGFA